MKLLAIDTATEGCSACLWQDGSRLSRLEVQPRKHAELILPMIDGLLDEAGLVPGQLDALAFGRGPGAFTGVRIATGVIQGIAYGADLPVVPVSTLRALAQRVYAERVNQDHSAKRVLSAFDARMNEVYLGAFVLDESALMQPVIEERVVKPEDLTLDLAINADWTGAGSGWGVYKAELLKALGTPLHHVHGDMITRADEIALLAVNDFDRGMAVDAQQALPVYLRNEVAWKKTS